MKFEVEKKDLKEKKSRLREVQLEETIHRRRDDTHAQTAPGRSVVTQNIFVIGGVGQDGEILRTVEKYIFHGGKRVPLPEMNIPRSFMSSVVVGNEIVVSGGDTGAEITDTIETLNLGETPLRWKTSSAKLPVPLSGHQTVVYQGRLIAIGGHNGDEGFNSDKIYEVCLTPPYSTKTLCSMPQPRAGHGAELIGDEIFIFGGTRNVSAPNNEVLVYNLVTREFRVMESLPYAVHGMATVFKLGIVMLLGGIDQNEEELDQVIAYNPQTGVVYPLPSMKEKRGSCCAVSHQTTGFIVVLGSSRRNIRSPERYDFRDGTWQDMPPLNNPRERSTMVVSPVIFDFIE
ncbi:kelch-like protein 18 [Dendronephthya gigantea]|uniref:kelch-like protein 18 n=1 Tax=Dendronephthya gigantea TaxID=151771 RepID=UPI00106ADF9A|nr:kelch-like protein 18 [Dendronephthya gigantea]